MKVSNRYYRKKTYNYIIKELFVYIFIYLGENVIINIKVSICLGECIINNIIYLNSSRRECTIFFFQRLMVKSEGIVM